MRSLVARVSPTLWLLPLLVVVLVLGHVCELPAYVELASHHHSDGSHHSTEENGHAQPGFCDAVTAPSTSGQLHHTWIGLDVTVTFSIVDVSPVGRTLQSFGEPAKLASRLPLFLLHSSLLI
ncbi:MAG TPA: hypothetical protein VIE36_09420 [Methylomirabilota bacterium]|jgi:hypothetical protein